MNYYVVALDRNDPLLEMFDFIGGRLARESVERTMAEIRRTGDSSFIRSLVRAQTFSFGTVMPGHELTVPEWMKFYMPTPEYEKFGKVYFLNEAAYRMYREGGVEFDIYKVIPDDELPEGCTRGIGVPYLPKEKPEGSGSDTPNRAWTGRARD